MRLFFLDIDGTICMPGKSPSPALCRIIPKLRAQGDKVLVCTGRTPGFVPESVQALGWDGGVYSAGGLAIAEGVELIHQTMPPEVLEQTMDVMEKTRACYTLECDDACFRGGGDMPALLDSLRKEHLHSELQRLIRMNNQKKPVEQYAGQPVFKVSFVLGTAEQAELMKKLKPENTDLVFFDSFGDSAVVLFGEIAYKQINKGSAMYKLCQFYGVTPADCIAFGDSMNDATVLQAAGTGWAMGNSSPKVKALADRVCLGCEEDGLALALQTYLRES